MTWRCDDPITSVSPKKKLGNFIGRTTKVKKISVEKKS